MKPCTRPGCPGIIERTTTNITLYSKIYEELVTINDIPIDRCSVCGLAAFSGHDVRKAMLIINNRKPVGLMKVFNFVYNQPLKNKKIRRNGKGH